MLNKKPFEQYIMAQNASVWRVEIDTDKVIVNGETNESSQKYAEWKNKPALASYEFIERNLSWQLGQILTIIDASISESKHNKAIKDLVKNSFYTRIHDVYRKLSGDESYAQEQQMAENEDHKDITPYAETEE